MLIPVNLIGYATADISYVEEVNSLVEVERTNIMEVESVEDIKNNNISVELLDVLNINNTNNKYSLLLNNKTLNVLTLDTMASVGNRDISFVMLGNTNTIIKDEQKEEETGNATLESVDNNYVADSDKEISTESETDNKTIVDEPSVTKSEALVKIENPDPNYKGQVVRLSDSDRDLLERLVMGEAGGEGYEGAALVAQTLRDHMVYHGYTSVETLRKELKYSGSIKKQPNEDVKKAVAFIFDEGGIAAQHKLYYFYAPKYSKGSWHNTQQFILEYGGHRFFCKWGE